MPSKLEQLQQQYRRQLLQEKEERMIKIHTESQQKALSKVSRYNSISSVPTVNSQSNVGAQHHSPVKKGSPGVDRSRPLPPISKERGNNASTRTSPVSAPTEDSNKVPIVVGSRSKSVDLVDSRQSPPRVQNERGNLRNGYAKVTENESRSNQHVEYERKIDPDTLAKMKQAELQRLRAKVREESPRSNGFTDTPSKSSNVQRKTPAAKPPTTTTTPARTRPSFQSTSSPASKKPAVTASRPAARGVPQASTGSEDRKPPGPGQEQCRVCGRNFNSDRIQKHVSICQKAAQKKVKVFDATKMRVQGTEAEQFVRKGAPKAETKPKQSDWRKKRNEFIEAIRQAKMVQQHLAKGGKLSELPPPPPSDNSDYVPCPYCGRKFSEGVADRHIPKCKNILSNKKNPVPKRK